MLHFSLPRRNPNQRRPSRSTRRQARSILAQRDHYDIGSPLLRTLVAFVTFTYIHIITPQRLTARRAPRQPLWQVVVVRWRKDLRQILNMALPIFPILLAICFRETDALRICTLSADRQMRLHGRPQSEACGYNCLRVTPRIIDG
jgi:hypothetical protein